MHEHNNEQFTNLNIMGEEFEELLFTDCEFIGCTIDGCRFQHCRFIDCTFTKCRLVNNKGTSQSQLRFCKFIDCFLIGISWNEWVPQIKFYQPFEIFNSCRIKYNNFVEMNLTKFNFCGNDLTESLFADCKLSGSSFKGCNLTKTEFFRCDLTKSDFRDALGYQISLETNKLKDARFSFPEVINLLNGLGIKID
ncbi:MAG: pentapeptide repeat-containing protein [Faecalibacterium sp.]|nr:pentapeptide repeat-containing protein [Ruminococcus sp.]MCM1391257.1 pentapeptide repeat-containing protein [Ruminococcus sp.]MCM1484769.1 pentapeptide repeat-containing protein [Faecalibacterium sp.]